MEARYNERIRELSAPGREDELYEYMLKCMPLIKEYNEEVTEEVTESKAVDKRLAGMPSDSNLNRRLVRKASPSPANMRVGSSFSRLKAKVPAV